MNTPVDYPELLIGIVLLVYGIYAAFSSRLFGKPARWSNFPNSGVMSPLSRWLAFAVLSVLGCWKVARGIFSLEPNTWVVALLFIGLILMLVAYLRDRKHRPSLIERNPSDIDNAAP